MPKFKDFIPKRSRDIRPGSDIMDRIGSHRSHKSASRREVAGRRRSSRRGQRHNESN